MSRLSNALLTLVALVGVVLMLEACRDDVVYDTYDHTQLVGWDKADTLYYNVSPLRTAGLYRQEVGLRINGSFPFTGVTLVVDQTVEPGHRLYSDTLRCKLTDNKGNTLGRGVSYYQFDFPVSELHLEAGDSLHISVRHIMKREILPGIADVGIRLSRVQ